MIIYWNPVGKGWTILDHFVCSTHQLNTSKHLFMFNLGFLKIAEFRSIEFVENLNQREFDVLPSFFYSMCSLRSRGREREARNTACPKTTHSVFRPPNAWFRPS
jgi:hypothetical protein